MTWTLLPSPPRDGGGCIFVLNSKEGGKSFIAGLIVQHELARRRPIRWCDGDATTATLSNFPALEAERLA